MNCRNCQCIVEEARFSKTPSGYVHVCTADHHAHTDEPEPDKRINTQPINTEEN
jgi:hypothetical protein